jgi:hypothetical protein
MTRTHDGRAVRMLTVVDEHTRKCLAIDVARRLSSEEVLERLAWLFVTRGVPEHIRSDNGLASGGRQQACQPKGGRFEPDSGSFPGRRERAAGIQPGYARQAIGTRSDA